MHITSNKAKDDNVINNIKLMKDSSIRTITVMLDKSKFEDCIKMFNYFKNIKPNIDIDLQLVFLKDVIDNYTADQYNRYLNLIKNNNDKFFEVTLKDNKKIFLSHNELYELTKSSYTKWLCNAGEDLLYIHVDGNVYCCDGYFNAKKLPLFNIYKTNVYIGKKTFCNVANCPFEDDVLK